MVLSPSLEPNPAYTTLLYIKATRLLKQKPLKTLLNPPEASTPSMSDKEPYAATKQEQSIDEALTPPPPPPPPPPKYSLKPVNAHFPPFPEPPPNRNLEIAGFLVLVVVMSVAKCN